MQVVHEPAGGEATTIASTVEVATSFFEKMRGLMFRRSIPDDYALAFRFGEAGARDIHMLFVRFPIDVIWVVDDVVTRVDTLQPWLGFGIADADLVLELPAGRATGVDSGDRIRLEPA